MVFAFGNKMLDVIHNMDFAYPTNSGVVLAWNKNAGNTNYEMFSTEDIFISPDTAAAYWDMKDGISGISYANGTNTGFVPIEGITIDSVDVETITNHELRIRVFPNPTTGQLTMDNGQLKINKVELFDICGRKVLEPPLTVLHSYNLTVLQPGIYFVKIETDLGVVFKKVIKL